MAPSASMLFLSYHQLQPHSHRPAEAEAEAPRKEAAAAGGFQLSVSSVFSLGVFERRREAAPAERDAGDEIKSAAELDSKFEEALRLSCWSS